MSLSRSGARAAYLFVTPAVLLILVFRAIPAVSALVHSFTRWSGTSPPQYVGLANFVRLLGDKVFWAAVSHNVIIVVSVPLWILVSLVLALLIHQETFGWRFFRAAYFLPSVLSPVIIGLLFGALLSPKGPVNSVLGAVEKVGPDWLSLTRDWLGDATTALPTLILIILWGIFGHGVIVFLAGLAAVPNEIFEAAKLDGATGWRLLWHIVIPSLRHVIEFWGVNLVVWSFTSLFGFVYVTTNGGPGYSTMLVSYQVYLQAFRSHRMGYACAIGTALFLMVFGVALLQIRLMTAKDD